MEWSPDILETFLARQRERDRSVPGFVETEFREFLDCGVFPLVPVRQWVLSLPYALRYRLAYDCFIGDGCTLHLHQDNIHFLDPPRPRIRRRAETPVRRGIIHSSC
jgi:hypothetical protein